MSKDQPSRRRFLSTGLAAAGSIGLAGALPANALEWQDYSARFNNSIDGLLPTGPARPDDEAAWQKIAKNYDVTNKIINLENGYWGIMARPVLAEFRRLNEFVNHENSYFARVQISETDRGIRESVANFLNVAVDEIALTRGATESLQALIGGYNKLRAGDTVLFADLDYGEMKTAMNWLEERRGAKPVKVTFPEPTHEKQLTEADILAFYEKSFDVNPGTKLLLLTHLNNLTGMVIPVAKIAKMAKERGIDVILDAAHSVGQIDFKLGELGCDFIGVNMHKWVGAPIGCGVIYIRKGRVDAIDTFFGKSPGSTDVLDRIDSGTSNFATRMAIPAAIAFHNKIGTAAKEARLKYLRSLWVEPAREIKGLTILAPDDNDMVGALTSFRFDGAVTAEANLAIARTLKDKYGILTVRRTGPAAGDCIRVTPSIYNSPQDLRKLANALRSIASTPKTR